MGRVYRKGKKYIDTLSDDEIVVVVDGFDTIINKDLDDVDDMFESLDCKVLYSLDGKNGLTDFIPKFIQNYAVNKIFGTCKDDVTANAGLYMGYCQYLKLVLDTIISGESDDDQRTVNSTVCKKFSFVKIDIDNKIFENCSNPKDISNAFFVQIPGTLTFNRMSRAMIEYPKYFVPEIIIILLVLYICL